MTAQPLRPNSLLLWADPLPTTARHRLWGGGGQRACQLCGGFSTLAPTFEGAFPQTPEQLGPSPQRSSFASEPQFPGLLYRVIPLTLPMSH